MKSKHAPGKILTGTVKRHPDGFGFVLPEDKSHRDIYIPSNKIGSALTYDRVEVWVQKRPGRQAFFGSVKTILKRHWEWASGPYEDGGLLKKHNLPCEKPVKIRNPDGLSVKKGDWVKVKLTSYPETNDPFQGNIVENLGFIPASAESDHLRILAEHNISLKFPKEVLRELKDIPDEVRPGDLQGRQNLPHPFVTIDGATAKDFDDAVFVKKYPSLFRLFVAVADVSHYVPEDSELDREAFLRGNSVYLPNFVNPMLPEKLSNNLCSLNPDKPRLALVAEMDFDLKGTRLKSQFYPAVIKNHRRLTYGEAQDIFDNPGDDPKWTFLKEAEELGRILIDRHLQNGALDLNIPETFVRVNERGEPVEILKDSRLFSHKLIEQFMLSANQAVSYFLKEKNLPFIRRIHESPETESFRNLENFSKSMGFHGSLKSRSNLLAFLKKFQEHPKEPLLNKLL